MAARLVECFYSMSSPWMYLGGPQLSAIIGKYKAKLELRPYVFRLVVSHTGGIQLRTRPEPRQDYHALELDRWARLLDMPINLKPAHYPPTDQRPAGRMVMAAQQRGMDAMALSHAILRALWAEERDIADPHERVKIADELGMPGAHLHAAEDSASSRRKEVRESTQREARMFASDPLSNPAGWRCTAGCSPVASCRSTGMPWRSSG